MSSSSLSLVDAVDERDKQVCESQSRELVNGQFVRNEESYENCILNEEKHEFWLEARVWILGLVILAIIVGVGIKIIKAKPLPKYSEDTDYSYTSTVRKAKIRTAFLNITYS